MWQQWPIKVLEDMITWLRASKKSADGGRSVYNIIDRIILYEVLNKKKYKKTLMRLQRRMTIVSHVNRELLRLAGSSPINLLAE